MRRLFHSRNQVVLALREFPKKKKSRRRNREYFVSRGCVTRRAADTSVTEIAKPVTIHPSRKTTVSLASPLSSIERNPREEDSHSRRGERRSRFDSSRELPFDTHIHTHGIAFSVDHRSCVASMLNLYLLHSFFRRRRSYSDAPARPLADRTKRGARRSEKSENTIQDSSQKRKEKNRGRGGKGEDHPRPKEGEKRTERA